MALCRIPGQSHRYDKVDVQPVSGKPDWWADFSSASRTCTTNPIYDNLGIVCAGTDGAAIVTAQALGDSAVQLTVQIRKEPTRNCA